MTRKEFEAAKAEIISRQRKLDFSRLALQVELNKAWDELMLHANNLEETAIVLYDDRNTKRPR